MDVVAVDWSGRSSGARRHIWTATVRNGELVELVSGRTRDEVAADLARRAAHVGAVVVGLDFAFSFPEWHVRALGCASVGELWELVGRAGEQWLSRCDPPFWGRPGRKRPELREHRRRTDRAATVGGIAAKSVFQVGGAGAVGTGSLRGMPHLPRLRKAGYSIWPFDPPAPATVVEIYPRLLTGKVRKSSAAARLGYVVARELPIDGTALEHVVASEDAFDAAVSALEMGRHLDGLGALAPATDATTLLEGEIWRPDATAPSVPRLSTLASAPAPDRRNAGR